MSPLRTLGALNREGMKSFNSGRNDDALFQLVQAERLARSIGSPLHEAKVRNNIGLVYQRSGSLQEALVSFRMAAEQAIQVAGEDTGLHRVIVRNLTRLETSLSTEAVQRECIAEQCSQAAMPGKRSGILRGCPGRDGGTPPVCGSAGQCH